MMDLSKSFFMISFFCLMLLNCKQHKTSELKDVVINDPAYGTLIFFANGDNIVVKACTNAEIKRREDCITQESTHAVEIHKYSFRQNLLEALLIPKDDYDLENVPSTQLLAKEAELKKRIDGLHQNITNIFGDTEDFYVKRLSESLSAASDYQKTIAALDEINANVTKIIDQLISSPEIRIFTATSQSDDPVTRYLQLYVRRFPHFALEMTFDAVPPGKLEITAKEKVSGDQGEADKKIDAKKTIEIKKPFAIGHTEVSQQQYLRVEGQRHHNPGINTPGACRDSYETTRSHSNGETGIHICPKLPISRLDYFAKRAFARKLTRFNDRYAYRLPSENEWLYAASAGVDSGANIERTSSGDEKLYNVGSKNNGAENYFGSGKKGPEDFNGNVTESTQDFEKGVLNIIALGTSARKDSDLTTYDSASTENPFTGFRMVRIENDQGRDLSSRDYCRPAKSPFNSSRNICLLFVDANHGFEFDSDSREKVGTVFTYTNDGSEVLLKYAGETRKLKFSKNKDVLSESGAQTFDWIWI